MPFQSEKQRKYLWANEPAIAREWTDKYGSRVKKQLGGILDIGYHGSPLYQDILSQGFKGGAGQSSRILGMNMPTWAGKGRTFVASNPSGAYRYGVPIEVAKSARNFTMPFGGGLDKRGISFAKETALNPKQATKGMNLMQKLRAGQYLNSPTAQRLLQTGTTAASRLGILGALSSLGGQAATALPLAYTYGASKLQESLPMSLIGQGGLSDQNPYFGAMGVSVDPTVEETLRYGDDGKPSPDTGEGSTLAKAWDAIKNEFGGSAEAADLSDMIPKNLEKTIEEGMRSYKKSNEISPALRKAIEEGTSYNEWDMIPNTKYHGIPMKRISLNQDEETYIDPKRIPGRIQKSVPRKMGMLERFRNRFYKPATSAAGGYNVSQLNKMNALGGYYSEPARQQRRTEASVQNMLARRAKGLSYSAKNLKEKSGGQFDFGGGQQGSHQTPTAQAPAGVTTSSGMHGGKHYNRGGLASLWQR